jgi:putative transposase
MVRRTPPRLAPNLYVGFRPCFLTICTHQRQRWFVDAVSVERATAQLRRTARAHAYALSAWCFMPDHLHVVIEALASWANSEKFALTFKQRSAFAHASAGGGHLWQRGFHDRLLRDNEKVWEMACYVLENPVRAGLVAHPADYPFSGSEIAAVDEFFTARDRSREWQRRGPRRRG